MKNLSPMLNGNLAQDFFEDKMEMFLTCRALTTYLKGNLIDEESGARIENLILTAVHNTLTSKISPADVELTLSELQNILPLNYPVIQTIRKDCIELIPQIKNLIKSYIDEEKKFLFWLEIQNFDNLLGILKTFDNYEHK